jgi:hypothetical protein
MQSLQFEILIFFWGGVMFGHNRYYIRFELLGDPAQYHAVGVLHILATLTVHHKKKRPQCVKRPKLKIQNGEVNNM